MDKSMNIGGPPAHVDHVIVRYSNKASGGSAINEVLKVGYAVCADIWNTVSKPAVPSAPSTFTQSGLGIAVTKPETANLTMFCGVIDKILPLDGGDPRNCSTECDLVINTRGFPVDAWTNANMTKGSTYLGCTNGSWALSALTSIAAISNIRQIVGRALETVDTSGTAAIAKVCLEQSWVP